MSEPTYEFIPGTGWVATFPTKIEIFAEQDGFVVIKAKDVPVGMDRSAAIAIYNGQFNRLFHKTSAFQKGPPSRAYRGDSWYAKVKLQDLIDRGLF